MGRDLRVGTANRRRDDDFRGGGERGSRDYANRRTKIIFLHKF